MCEVCGMKNLPQDTSIIDTFGRRVTVRGRINAVAAPEKAAFSPFGHYYTAPLYSKKSPVKYLKFREKADVDRWDLERNLNCVVKGCLHICDGKELIFDITEVNRVNE